LLILPFLSVFCFNFKLPNFAIHFIIYSQKAKCVDIDSLMTTLVELEDKDKDFKVWVQTRSDKVSVLIRSSAFFDSVKFCEHL